MASKLFLAAAALLVFSSTVSADPAWIQAGAVELRPFSLTAVMGFGGLPSFSVSAIGDIFFAGVIPCRTGCTAGQMLSLSGSTGFMDNSDMVGGTITLNGTIHNIVFPPANLPDVSASGSMGFAAGSVLIPSSGDPTITLTSSFSLTPGSGLALTANPGFFGSLQFVGGGGATVILRNQGNGQYIAQTAFYSFSPAQTPEPTTLILLSSGILGFIAKTKLKRWL